MKLTMILNRGGMGLLGLLLPPCLNQDTQDGRIDRIKTVKLTMILVEGHGVARPTTTPLSESGYSGWKDLQDKNREVDYDTDRGA